MDDPRYFEHPDRYNADILWFTRGYVEYAIPNFIPASKKITQITISAELSSEAPGTNNDWPSDISFYLNDIHIGDWTSPGDFGDVKGLLTPDWWYANWNQYGLLKQLVKKVPTSTVLKYPTLKSMISISTATAASASAWLWRTMPGTSADLRSLENLLAITARISK